MAYIEKELVQKCLDDLSNGNLIGNDNDTYISIAEAKDKIEELPTADVAEVKHGTIIETIKDGKSNRVFSCCNTDFTKLTMWIIPDYCPKCGAKMKGI